MKILLLDLDPRNRLALAAKTLLESQAPWILAMHCCAARESGPAAEEIRSLLENERPDLIFLAIGALPESMAFSVFRHLRAADVSLPVVLAASAENLPPILEILRHGMTDFVTLPLRPADIVPRFMRLLARVRKEDSTVLKLKEKLGMRKMIGSSSVFLAEIHKIPLLARCDASVMITGETGTGKEMCARAIHYLSPRAGHPFVAVNCGALPADLVENELFGHEREAFTGAAHARPGLIKEADSGTLFLDEVDSLPALAQVKLLRFLQEKEYRPLGSGKTHKADVRIIAASNLDLAKAVDEGKIRQDFYYRLNVVGLRLPALRERSGDLPALIDHFTARFTEEYNLEPVEWSSEALRRIIAYSWPGNIREVEHVVQRTLLLASGPILSARDIDLPCEDDIQDMADSFKSAKAELIRNFEKEYIQNLLAAHKGNISHAAATAKKNRRAFWQLMQKYGIHSAASHAGSRA